MNYKIAAIAGDGIGPEIVREARKVLDKVGQKYGHTFTYEELLMGGCSIDVYGESLTGSPFFIPIFHAESIFSSSFGSMYAILFE